MTLKEEAELLLLKAREAIDSGDGDKANAALDHIELFLSPFVEPTETRWDIYRFTRREQRVVDCLFHRIGKTTNRDVLMNAVYFDHVNDWPQEKIIEIFLCRIRAKLTIDNAYHIETAFNHGWKMLEGPAPDGKLASGYRTGRTRILTTSGIEKPILKSAA